MSEQDRLEGLGDKVTGNIEENVGELTGDRKLEFEGKADEFHGSVKDGVADARDAGSDAKADADAKLDDIKAGAEDKADEAKAGAEDKIDEAKSGLDDLGGDIKEGLEDVKDKVSGFFKKLTD